MTLYCNIFNASAAAAATTTTSLSMFYSSAIARTMMAEVVVDEAADNMVDIITDDNASINVLLKNNTTTVEEVAAAAASEEEEELTTNFKHMFAIVVPRITGCIALFVSFGMFYMAYKRRDRIFHRLVFGMTVHICLSSIFDIYGNAAVPAAPIGTGTGTITTCTIQGFFLYVTWATSLLYYATLCIYSYVGIMNNFITNKYKWIEKYIHICVHIYPITLGLTYVYYKAYNDTGMGYCDILGKAYNSPLFIDNDKLVQEVQSYLRVSFYIFLLLFPTIVMIILYYKVKFNQETIYVIRSVNIVKQTIIYLFPLYWTLLPYIIIFISEIVMSMNWEKNEDYETNIDSKNTTKSPETISQIVYPFYAYADINYFLFSVWCFLAYFYFSYYDSDSDSDIDDSSAAAPAAEDLPPSATATAGINATLRTNECIFNTHSNIEDNDDNNNGNNNETQQLQNDHNPTTTTTEARIGEEADNNERRSRRSNSNGSGSGNIRRRRTKSRKYSFNIFDGTNASGAFADFVHDGDSEDEKIDNEQTKHWEIVQDHV